MVLSMTRPFLHPKTGVFYFRKGVPEHLRPILGKREEKVSLGTKDPAEARRRHAVVAAEVDVAWGKAMAAPVLVPDVPETPLPEREVVALSGELYRETVEEHGANPGRAVVWQKKLMDLQLALPERLREPGVRQTFRGQWVFGPAQVAGRLLGGDIDRFLERRGLRLPWQSRNLLCYHGALALAQAYRELAKRAQGDYRPDPDAVRFPAYADAVPPAEPKFKTWRDLYELYLAVSNPAPATRKRQTGVLAAFFGWLGHDDPLQVTRDNAKDWRTLRLKAVSPQTVRDADIAHPKTLFSWALGEDLVPANPFHGIKVKVETVETRSRDLRREEAEKILAATFWPVSARMTVEGAAVRRWVPWLCAYCGARVNEITQLRALDVRIDEETKGSPVWILRLTPEAGRIKTSKARDVPLHPHLIEQGFLDYVKTRKGRHLFYDPGRGRGGDIAHPAYKKAGERLAAWIRDKVGVTDTDIDPNHGWRHLWKSKMMEAGVLEQIIDQIDGHAPASVGRKYGRANAVTMLAAIGKIPRYDVDGA